MLRVWGYLSVFVPGKCYDSVAQCVFLFCVTVELPWEQRTDVNHYNLHLLVEEDQYDAWYILVVVNIAHIYTLAISDKT